MDYKDIWNSRNLSVYCGFSFLFAVLTAIVVHLILLSVEVQTRA